MEKIERIKENALGFPEKAKQLIVNNSESLVWANNFILSAKETLKEIAESYDPIIKHAQAEKKKYSDPVKEAMGTARQYVTSYLEDQAEIQRKVDEKARKEEEKRRKKEEEALERAMKLQDEGKEKKAAKILEKIEIPESREEAPRPVVQGLSLKQIVDTDKINQIVAATKGRQQIPGIRIYPVWKWEITDRKLIPKAYYKSSMATRTPKGG